jgi:hypothetical protein
VPNNRKEIRVVLFHGKQQEQARACAPERYSTQAGACPYRINLLNPLTRAVPTLSLEGEGEHSPGEGVMKIKILLYWLSRLMISSHSGNH